MVTTACAPSLTDSPTDTAGFGTPRVEDAEVADLRWLTGSWVDGRHAEHWRETGGALFGVGFRIDAEKTRLFDVMLVERSATRGGAAPGLRLVAMPNGASEVVFELVDSGADASRRWAVFENLNHDDPIRIRYERRHGPDGDALHAEVTDRERQVTRFTWRRDPNPPCVGAATAPMSGGVPTDMEQDAARVVLDADVAFERATERDGADGWVSYFGPEGAMWDRRAQRHLRGEAIRAESVK